MKDHTEREQGGNSGNKQKFRSKLLTPLVAQYLKIQLPMQETWVQSLIQGDPHDPEQVSLCTATSKAVF